RRPGLVPALLGFGRDRVVLVHHGPAAADLAQPDRQPKVEVGVLGRFARATHEGLWPARPRFRRRSPARERGECRPAGERRPPIPRPAFEPRPRRRSRSWFRPPPILRPRCARVMRCLGFRLIRDPGCEERGRSCLLGHPTDPTSRHMSAQSGASRSMKVLCCHPSGLMYTEIYLRLEPLGVELAAAAARAAGHAVRILDLQVFSHADYFRMLDAWSPDVVAFGANYLANIPEVIDLAKETRRRLPGALFVVGGHSASFTAPEILEHAQGAIDCVIKGEAEEIFPRVLAAARDRDALGTLPGVVTRTGEGPPPEKVRDLDALTPARDLLPRRRKYFIGVLDPAASIELSRGCPWDCSFCSAWTFYGRTHRQRDPAAVG